MPSFPQQFLYLADSFGTPQEIVNGARTAKNISTSAQPVITDAVTNMGCDGYLVAPTAPAALNDAVGWWDALDGAPSRQGAPNRGIGGPVLNGQLGATTAASTDEPLWLGGGEHYLYLPGVASNTATLPNSAGLQVTGDIEIVLRVAVDSIASGSAQALLSKYTVASNGYEVSLSSTGTVLLTTRLAASDVSGTSTAALPTTLNGRGFWLKVTRVSATGAVNFWYSTSDGPNEPRDYQQLGTSVTVTTGAIASGTAVMTIGARTVGTTPAAAKFFRAIVRAVIAATTPANVLDVDFTANSSQTSFTATAGGVVTINRSTTGRKSVVYLGRPLWLFGTDDFIQLPDADLLDFAANESFTVMVVQRSHNVAVGAIGTLVAKSAGAAGWALTNTATATASFTVSDGTFSPAASSPNRVASTLHVTTGVRDVVGDTITAYTDSVAGTPVADTTTATLANASLGRIGYLLSATLPFDGELMAILVWRRALSATEVAAVSTFYKGAPQLAGRCWTAVDLSATAAPWYSAAVPESAEAIGFFIEEWSGLDGAHHTRTSTPTGQNRGGAYYGPQSHSERTWKLNMLVMASTERGMEYLFRWLESTLLRCCGTDCDSQFAWIRQICPSDPDNAPQEGLARAERVVLREGPTWESPPLPGVACYLRRVSFTLSAGDPCLYRDPQALAYAESTLGSATTGATLASCSGYNGSSMQVRAAMDGPDGGYGSSAPLVTITSVASTVSSQRSALPALRIAGYLDPLGYGDICRATLIGELILEAQYSSGLEIVADLAKRRVRMRQVGTFAWLDGSRLIGRSVRSGLPRWWSFGPCDVGIVVVEPVYQNASVTRTTLVASQVGSWTVRIEQGARFGCC